MRIDLVSYRSAPVTTAAPSLLSEWRVGAILQAVAVRDASGQLWLDIADQRLPARIASGDGEGPQDGEQLQVRVLRNHPVLALETLASKTAETDAAEQSVTADALRRFAPRQESPALMLANLAWLAQGKNTAQLPKEVADAAAQLWRSLPDARALQDPEQLRAALERSGTFLENNLAAGKQGANVATDIKALMLELSRVLRDNGARPALARSDVSASAPLPTANGALSTLPNTPATLSLLDASNQQLNELSRQTEGALARLTTVQLANNTANPHNPALMVELPVRFEDRANVLRLRIERDATSSQQQEPETQAWSVEAAMDLGAAGSLHARVTLRGHRVGVQIRASSPEIVASFSAQRGTLESMLRAAGLEVDRVVCLHGMPATDNGSRPTRLVDVRA
jgi:flagellar hook-length control protein FliK